MRALIRPYVSRFIWIIVSISGLHTTADCSCAQHEIFNESVIQKWKDYEAFSHGLQGIARHQSIKNGNSQEERVKCFRQNRECALAILPDNSDPLLLFCALANSRYTATITLSKSDLSNAILQKYMPAPGHLEPMSPFDLAFYETSRHFAYRATSTLQQAVSDPSFKVTEVAREIQNGRELIRIDHIYKIRINDKSNNSHTRIHGSLWLDPSRCWCIHRFKGSYEATLRGERSSDMELEVVCETVDHPSGFPILKSSTQHAKVFQYKNQQKNETTTKIVYELEVSDNVPDSEFTLTAFGLPEPGSELVKKPIPIYVWILGVAVTFAVLALGFRFLARRVRPKPAYKR